MPDNRMQYNPFLMNLAVNSNSGTYVFTQNTDIHTQPSFSSPIVATYNKGESVYYINKIKSEGYNWLQYNSYSGVAHYVAVEKLANDTPIITNDDNKLKSSGTYKFTQESDVHVAPQISSQIVATYNPGDTVYYNSVKQSDGYNWLVYIGGSGATRYVAVSKISGQSTTTNVNHYVSLPSSGSYKFTQDTNVYTQPSMSASVVATYNIGETVNYYQTKNNDGYTWLVYTSGSGQTHYVPVLQNSSSTSTVPSVSNNHKTVWPFAKPYNGYYEPDQKFGMTNYLRNGQHFHDGFDFGDAIYGKGATVRAITSGKIIYVGYMNGLDEFIVEQADDGNQIIYQEFSYSSRDVHTYVGKRVNAGDSIATMTNDHLHVGVTYENWQNAISHSFDSNGPWINPITYIQSHL